MKKDGKDNKLLHCSSVYSDEVLALTRKLRKSGTEHVLCNQLLKSGTSVGANVKEAQRSQGRKDFISKLEIASKECDESEQWFDLLYHAGDIDKDTYEHFRKQWIDIQRMLVSSVRTAKRNLEEEEQKKKEAKKKL